MAKAILLSSRLRHLKFDVLTESYKRDKCLILIIPKGFHLKAEGLKLRLSSYLNPQPAQSQFQRCLESEVDHSVGDYTRFVTSVSLIDRPDPYGT